VTITLAAASWFDLSTDILRISNDFVRHGVAADNYVINITGDLSSSSRCR